jgi:CheY-like chemotaxis protein
MTPISSIYLIDDDRTSNLINTEIVRIFNKEILVTSYLNAAKAIEDLERLSMDDPDKIPSVIFLDINMPLINGWEFLETLKKINDTIQKICKVYILTSSIDPDDIERSKSYKMVQGFISKPLTITHLKLITEEKKANAQYLSHLKFFYPTNSGS